VNSALYEGTIRHRRFAVREHAFTHRLAMAYVDLDELPELPLARGPVRFERADYLGDPAVPLADAVRALIAARTGAPAPSGAIRVLANVRSFGRCFNPIVLYYCFGADERLECVVAEVTNTPWGERHAYVLPRSGAGPVLGGDFEKALHVSPFMGMDHEYELRAAEPGPTLSVHIESRHAGAPAFDATLGMRRRPLRRRRLAGATFRTLSLIYAHAAVLRLKGVRIHPHPRPEAS
jgi:uncharacterized protein